MLGIRKKPASSLDKNISLRLTEVRRVVIFLWVMQILQLIWLSITKMIFFARESNRIYLFSEHSCDFWTFHFSAHYMHNGNKKTEMIDQWICSQSLAVFQLTLPLIIFYYWDKYYFHFKTQSRLQIRESSSPVSSKNKFMWQSNDFRDLFKTIFLLSRCLGRQIPSLSVTGLLRWHCFRSLSIFKDKTHIDAHQNIALYV